MTISKARLTSVITVVLACLGSNCGASAESRTAPKACECPAEDAVKNNPTGALIPYVDCLGENCENMDGNALLVIVPSAWQATASLFDCEGAVLASAACDDILKDKFPVAVAEDYSFLMNMKIGQLCPGKAGCCSTGPIGPTTTQHVISIGIIGAAQTTTIVTAPIVPTPTMVEVTVRWAALGGACRKDVKNEEKGKSGIEVIQYNGKQSIEDCEERCRNYMDTNSKRCYGVELKPDGTNTRQCNIWVTPILGWTYDPDVQCKIPYGSVVAMHMVISGLNTWITSSVPGAGQTIEASLNEDLVNSDGISANQVSSWADMSYGIVSVHVALPVTGKYSHLKPNGTRAYIANAQTLEPSMREDILNHDSAPGITNAGETLNISTFDVSVWGEDRARIEDTSGAFSSILQMALLGSLLRLVLSAFME